MFSGGPVSAQWVTAIQIELHFVFSWNHAFKNQITTLQGQAKNRANPNRSEVQANLSLFLEAASGFYTQVSSTLHTTFPGISSECSLWTHLVDRMHTSCNLNGGHPGAGHLWSQMNKKMFQLVYHKTFKQRPILKQADVSALWLEV